MKNKENYIKLFLGIITGILITSTTVSAAILYQSSNVGYSNTTSGLEADNVYAAINELKLMYDKAKGPKGTVKHFYLIDTYRGDIEYKYYFESGMTWDGISKSMYTKDTENGYFTIDTSGVFHSKGQAYIRLPNGTLVKGTDAIIAGTTYIMDTGDCCFDPDTLVTIDLEGNTKKIKDIEVGDTIVVENVNTKEKYLTTVLKDASEHPKTYDMTILTFEDGTTLKFNSYHPIYTTEGYKSVTNYNNYPTLEEGDYAVDSNNSKKKITKIHRYMEQKPIMTYNLLIKGIKEFYLEEEYSYIANDTLVHTGIAKYDDEDEWREKNRNKCIQEEVYKDFNYDKATDEELISYLVELKVTNEEAFQEYIKYYISADQYYRYAKMARTIKTKANEISNTDYLHYVTKDKNTKLSK